MHSIGTEGRDPVVKFEFKAYIEPPATIVIEERDNIINRVIKHSMDTKDKLIRAKLIELGWIHRELIRDAAKRELEVLRESN